ncbi:MAG: N-formylglutamate amidohydrolase, partial [Spirochaetales bacterium]|nr:N-formylglutamate amidohydrolase [Candidatus Physcosoma equi]
CIVTVPGYTPKKLENLVVKFFERRGYQVGVNTPYSGSILPHHLRVSGPPLCSIMIEVNRKLYLKPGTNEKSENFQKIQELLFSFQMMLLSALQ